MPYLLQQLLEISAKQYPDKEAVIYKNNSITYRELETISNQLAWVLKSSGIEKGNRVGICLKKSIEEIIAIYGILKAGAAYVSMEPSNPAQRNAYFIENCGIKALITTEKLLVRLYKEFASCVSQYLHSAILTDEKATEDKDKFFPIKIITWQDVLSLPSHPLTPADLIDCDLANITYTSGSTGQPKGVMVTHRSILNSAGCFYHYLEVQPGERISHQLPSYFIASFFDIFTSIQAGATIVVVPPELPIFPIELADFIEAQRINIWFSVPSLLIQLILQGNLQKHKFPDLRKIMFAGEVFPVQYLRQLMEMIPHVQYCNNYGSAETGARTYYLFKDISPDLTSVPSGKACANTELFVVNEQNEIATPGEVGELYARGSSLMKGYWGNLQKTKEVLVPYTVHPHLGEEIVFRTGDLVKQDADGNYIFVGRRDHQIKSRGYRIELGEIESTLYSHPDIEEAVVIAIPDEEIGNRLKAIVATGNENTLKKRDLEYFCAERLPKYMIPEIEFRSSLPKTSTGKIDRTLLRTEELQGNSK
jgi:amino acid adenylation domain-containing protein